MAAHTVVSVTAMAGRRSRRAVTAPARLAGRIARDTTFVVAGIPIQLAALVVLALPLAFPGFVVISLWQLLAALLAGLAAVALLRLPLTRAERHRLWSLLGLDIPRAARAALVIRRQWPELAVLVLSQYVEER